MREIKFRVWDKKNKRMEKASLYNSLSSYDPGKWKIVDWDGDGREGDKREIDGINLILIQYTGLKDKNGKEIYEGDILDWRGAYRTVYWDDNQGAWYAKNQPEGTPTLLIDIITVGYWVVGNIYENPELIK
jgi:uncharacterized phage protein (TIGR01671 family)